MSVIQLFLLSVCLALSVAQLIRCPTGWYHRGVYCAVGSCYKVNTTAMTYNEAKAACKAKGASLAGVADIYDHDFIKKRKEDAGLHGMWIGLYKDPDVADDCATSDMECRRQNWKWEDGTAYNHNVFHKWVSTEPSNKQEVCARLTATSNNHNVWAGQDCTKKYGYICKKGAYW